MTCKQREGERWKKSIQRKGERQKETDEEDGNTQGAKRQRVTHTCWYCAMYSNIKKKKIIIKVGGLGLRVGWKNLYCVGGKAAAAGEPDRFLQVVHGEPRILLGVPANQKTPEICTLYIFLFFFCLYNM